MLVFSKRTLCILELTPESIKTFLRDHYFPAVYACKLGEQLDGVSPGDIETFKKNHKDWDGILSDIIDHWLNNELNRSWEKLARALSACGCEDIAAKILGNEPIGKLHTLLRCNNSDFFMCVLKTLELQLPKKKKKRENSPDRENFQYCLIP